MSLASQVDALRDIGRRFYARGWSVVTSSNYSLVTERDPLELLVTASGMDKGQLGEHDFVRVNSDGLPIAEGQPRSSAETMLHVALAREPEINSVLHTHSIWGTLLSDLFFEDGSHLQFEHTRRTNRWARASSRQSMADRFGQLLQSFRLNAKHLQLFFEDGSDAEFFD